jgi:hypothetical protein
VVQTNPAQSRRAVLQGILGLLLVARNALRAQDQRGSFA